MRVIIEPDYEKLSQWAADYVVNKIRETFCFRTSYRLFPYRHV